MNDPHDPDIGELHHAVLRERPEPFEGSEPVPRLMIAAAVLLVAWGGWYLGRYDAKFDADRADMQAVTTAAAAPTVDLQALGGQVFASRCAACHQGTGAGMPGVFPPLAGSEWVTGDADRLVKVVLHGLEGPIEVAGQPYQGAMPAWEASLTDEEIAAVLTFARASWGNQAAPVDPATVAGTRSSTPRSAPWTASEL